MLYDVLMRVAEDTGLHAVEQRTQLVNLLNNSAREIYQELECNRIMREISVVVGRNKLVSLPSLVGDLRGMRQHTTEQLIPLESMGIRYASDTLGYRWKNWREVGESAVHTFGSQIDTITFESAVVENVEVTISGPTNTAQHDQETVTLNASSVETTKLFQPQIKSISCKTVRAADIVIKDSTGIEIARLYNNEMKTRYRIVDVSDLFWGVDTSGGDTIVDVLFKAPLVRLSEDTDSFPAGDIYDEAWHARSMYLHYSVMANKQEDAKAFRVRSVLLLNNIKDGSERNVIKKMIYGRNKYMLGPNVIGSLAEPGNVYIEQ
jgi:hypothetical protein